MKKSILSILSLTLFVTPITSEAWQKRSLSSQNQMTRDIDQDEQTLTSLWDIVKLHLVKYPDNLNKASIIVAGSTALAGLITYYGTDTILRIPVIGNLLQSITKDLVTPDDLLQGLSLVVGISGTLGLYQNSTELRQKFLGSFTSILLAKQVSKPHTAEPREVWDSALQAFALLHLLGTAEKLVTPIVEKSIQRAMKRVRRDEITLAEQHSY